MRKERPILFSTDMVQAILDGRKTMTRRILKKKLPDNTRDYGVIEGNLRIVTTGDPFIRTICKCPYGQPGDILWVRETYEEGCMGGYIYKAGRTPEEIQLYEQSYTWKPSIFMPKAAARIWLEITDIRAERLEDISQQDAINEGIKYVIDKVTGFCGYDYFTGGYNLMTTGAKSFLSLWRKIRKMDRYDTTGNPWVWVISFKVLSTTGRPHEKLGPF